MKRLSLVILAAAICTFSVTAYFASSNVLATEIVSDFTKFVSAQFEKVNDKLPEERIYLHLDKTFYSPGDTIWYAAYITNAVDMKPSHQSDIIQVQLISPKGTIQNEYKLICKNGKASGDFQLSDDLPGGMYKIKAFSRYQKNEPDSLFFEKEIQVQNIILPHLKMKLDFERKAYGKGDDVIAKLQLETNDNKPLSNYNFTYQAQLNGQKLIAANSQTGNDGVMYIKFALPKRIDSNDGLLSVTIDYEGQTESISRSIPIVLDNISLQFYPEGGDLVSGIENRVAFKAKNEFGKPADIEGIVYNSNGTKVTTFKSYYNGMGAFVLPCQNDDQYTARITIPAGIEAEFVLPALLEKGYVLNTKHKDNNEIEATVLTQKAEQLSIVAQVRGKIYYSTKLEAEVGKNTIIIPTLKMPMGVCQLTLFDSKSIAHSERLVFVNKHKQLQIDITTNKEKYLTREKVFATIHVKDEMGMPVAANLSLSVTNDELLAFADDKQGNLLSELYLQQDIKGKIDEPAFYFSKDAKSNDALDYLLMTSGWRRFKWEQILTEQYPKQFIKPEKTSIRGQIIDIKTGKPVNKASIHFGKLTLQSNEDGKYVYNKLDLSEPKKMKVSMDGFENYEEEINSYQDADETKVIQIYPIGYRKELERVQLQEVMVMDAVEERAIALPGRVFNDEIQMMPAKAQDEARKRAEAGAKAKAEAEEKSKTRAEVRAKANADAKAKKEGEKPKAANGIKNVVIDGKADVKNEMAANGARLDLKVKKQILPPIQPNSQIKFYRTREFAIPDYSKATGKELRNDFRKTIYWNPDIVVDASGKKEIEFYTNDEITSFKFITEGIGSNGYGAHAEKSIYTQLPFSMSIKMPQDLVQDDILMIPITLKNNTNKELKGKLNLETPLQLKFVSLTGSNPISLGDGVGGEALIPALSSITMFAKFVVGSQIENAAIKINFKLNDESDSFEQNFNIKAKGFPVNVAFSGKETNNSYTVDITNLVKGSLRASATAYPSVVSDLMAGVESILREPSGCFEQTSMSSYPNVLVRNYLKSIGSTDPKLESKADAMIERGYKKLVSFETREKGYEWFGGAPGHEALTAYGLMQFNDMKDIYSGVDKDMMDRTANWLMASKDGKGGYKRNPRALDNFGGANQNITDAYITYALACANYENITLEIDKLYDDAKLGKDPYIMALAANALFEHRKDKRAQNILDDLLKKQQADGSFMGAFHSITRSTDKALRVETTSLAVMAMLQSESTPNKNITDAVDFIIKSRNGNSDFGNSQSTIMALKALTKFAEYAKQTNEDGVLEIYVDGNKVGEKEYAAGEKNAIVLASLEKFLGEGKHKLQLKYRKAKNNLPYSIAVSWNTTNPVSSDKCLLDLAAELSSKSAKMGETVRLTINLKNKTNDGLASTMVVVGIPSGCSAQPWQLKELQEKKVFDYYEINGNMLNIYYRQMAPSESKTINFDLKTEVPGSFTAPATSAYLYYTNEYKIWKDVGVFDIK